MAFNRESLPQPSNFVANMGRGPTPAPVAPTPATPPPAAAEPPAQSEGPTLQELAYFIRMYGGSGGIDPNYNEDGSLNEQQQRLLAAIQKFDPDANFRFEAPTWNEGSTPGGQRLFWDASKLPGIGGPGKGQLYQMAGDFTPMLSDGQYNNGDLYYDDPNWGKITARGNEQKQKDPWWTVAAPLAVGMLAPWAAGGLAAAGIGGAAGLTSSVTGSGMGAAAGGMLGKGIGGAVKALPGFARNVSSGNWAGAGMSALGAGAGVMGGLGGTLGHVGQGLSTVGKWLPLANAAAGMMRRK